MSKFLSVDEALDVFFSLPDDPNQSSDSEEEEDGDDVPSGAVTRSEVQPSSTASQGAAQVSAYDVHSSDDASDDEETASEWTIRSLPHRSNIPDYCCQTPATPKLPPTHTPIMIFDALFGGALTILVEQTNIYAKETKTKAWQDTAAEEMKGFLDILIRMGILQLQNRRDYWSTDSDLGVASVSPVMPRARLFQLLRSLHANDNKTATRKGDVGHVPLHKLRPLITELSETFRASYQPSAYHSIDESMILFKGRKSFKQYMPMKPIKCGFKVWVLADATTGSINQFEVYTGKEGDGGGLGYRVIQKFTEELVGTECLVVFDNFFSSPELMQNLFDHGIYAVGTVRAQRKGLPDVVKNKKKINEGDHNYKVKGNVAAIQWQDKRLANVVATDHDPSETVTVEKKNKDASKRSIKCPLAIVQYTKHMRGVDRFDQLREYHTVTRKSRKWWMRIFYFLLDCALVNNFILYQLSEGEANHQSFLLILARQLANGYNGRKRSATTAFRRVLQQASTNKNLGVPDEVHLSNGPHYPQGKAAYKRCRYCSTAKNDKRSKITCTTCKVHLCVVPCFAKCHQEYVWH